MESANYGVGERPCTHAPATVDTRNETGQEQGIRAGVLSEGHGCRITSALGVVPRVSIEFLLGIDRHKASGSKARMLKLKLRACKGRTWYFEPQFSETASFTIR